MDARRVAGVVGAADRLGAALQCKGEPVVGEEKVKGKPPIFLLSFDLDGVTVDVSFPVDKSEVVVDRLNKMVDRLGDDAAGGGDAGWRTVSDPAVAAE